MNSYLERPGNTIHGSLTMVATVLADGDEERDPVCIAARASLDGHIVLSTTLARAGRFPAIDVLASASRTAQAVVDSTHRDDAGVIRQALALLAATEDFRSAGLADGTEPRMAKLIAAEPALEAFLRQRSAASPQGTRAELRSLAASLR